MRRSAGSDRTLCAWGFGALRDMGPFLTSRWRRHPESRHEAVLGTSLPVGAYAALLLGEVPEQPPAENRREAIDRVREAVCLVEAE